MAHARPSSRAAELRYCAAAFVRSELAPYQWTPSTEVIPGVESPQDDQEEREAQAAHGRV